MAKLIETLTEEDIQKYSELFHKPENLIKGVAEVFDNLKEFESYLYYLDEEQETDEIEDDEDDEDFDDDEFEEYQNNQSNIDIEEDILSIIEKELTKKLGLKPDEIKGKIQMVKFHPLLLNHICPFNQLQKQNIDCKFCPLQTINFIQIVEEYSKHYKISIEEAAEIVKFNTYRFPNKTYEKIIDDMKRAKNDDSDN